MKTEYFVCIPAGQWKKNTREFRYFVCILSNHLLVVIIIGSDVVNYVGEGSLAEWADCSNFRPFHEAGETEGMRTSSGKGSVLHFAKAHRTLCTRSSSSRWISFFSALHFALHEVCIISFEYYCVSNIIRGKVLLSKKTTDSNQRILLAYWLNWYFIAIPPLKDALWTTWCRF